MAARNFQPLCEQLLGLEGGVSDRPLSEDPGGLTNRGVTQAVYDRWRAVKGLPPKSVRAITTREAIAIARANYWDPVQGDKLPSGVDWAVFDFSFNSGPAQAVKELQRTLGVKVDGIVGLETLEALAICDPVEVINGVCDRRWAFMQKLKNFKPNKNGWRNRVAHVRAQSLALAAGNAPAEPSAALTSMPTGGRADPPASKPKKKQPKVWAAITGAVSVALTWIGNTLAQIPEFATTALNAINPFAEKSEIAQMIATGIGGLGAVAAAYVAFVIVRKKDDE